MNSQIQAALINAVAIILSAIISAIVALLIESKFNLIDTIKYKIIGKEKAEKTIVFSSKKELPSYKESIEKATSEICLLSIHAISLIRFHESLIEEKLQSGCQLKILSVKQNIKPNVINPNIQKFQEYTLHSSVLEDIIASKKYTNAWLNKLSTELKGKVEIRYYEDFPTILSLMIDKSKENGFAIVEPIFPDLIVKERIAFKICNADNNHLMKNISKSFENLWNRSS